MVTASHPIGLCRMAVPLSCLVGASLVLIPGQARAEREVVVVYEEPEPVRSGLNLGLDVEGAVPTATPRSLSGNTLSGGGGFKFRVGDQIRMPYLRVTPEGGYAFDHIFATDPNGAAFDWDMHRLFGGVRLGFGRVVVPGLYAHLGYGWRDTGDPTVPPANGLAFDAGFSLDLHLIPHVGFGGHAEYDNMNAQPFVPQWVALGLHGDVMF